MGPRISPIWFVTLPLLAIVAGGFFGMSMSSSSQEPEAAPKLNNVPLRRPSISALPSSAAVSPESAPRPPDADSLIADARAAYRNASTYQDTTAVDDEFIIGNGLLVTHVGASHAFVRSSSSSKPAYRFEFTAANSAGHDVHFVMWERDGAVKTWSNDAARVASFASLESALSTPTGMSHGATTTVPGLLRDDVNWPARGLLGRLAPPLVVAGVDRIDGVDCWVIDGKPNKSLVDKPIKGPDANAVTNAAGAASLWIGRDDRLVHRYEAKGPRGVEVIPVKPVLNETLPSSMFEPTPPPR